MVNVQRMHRDELSHLVQQLTSALAYVVGVVPAPPPYEGVTPHSVVGSGVVITPDADMLTVTCHLHVQGTVTCISERCVVVQSLLATITRRTLNRDVVVNVIVTDLLA
jgi:hypothetical protein